MKFIKTEIVGEPKLAAGHFNRCEHTFLECEAGQYQTISVKLPNQKVVAFAFIPGDGDEMECVDIHATVGKAFKY